MKIAVDAMGGDNAPYEIVKGAVLAANEMNEQIVLIGKSDEINSILQRENARPSNIEVVHAPDVIKGEDSPVAAIRSKRESSMYIGLEMLRDKECDAFVSAGNTGALMAGALMVVGRIKGIKRPALAPIIPTRTGNMLIIDAGSNTDCDEENLMQFARMGSIYCSYVLDIENPRVGIFNIGSEPGKGNEVTKKVYKLLELSDLNFVGNIEGRDIPFGKADVLVCDGFVGNAILKSMEGIALLLLDMMKEELMRNWVTRMCALVLKDGFKRIAKKMDYSEYGGAPLLGINGACIKAHGTSNAKTIKNAIFQARKYVSGGVIDYIHKEILSGVDISG